MDEGKAMKKNHIGSHNDYPCHRRVKGDAKRISTSNVRAKLKRDLAKIVGRLTDIAPDGHLSFCD